MANDTLIWLEAGTALRPDDPAMRRLQVLEPRAAAPLYQQETNPGKDWWRGLPEGRPEMDDVPGEGGRFGPGAGAARGGSPGGIGGLETPWGRMGDRGRLGDRGSTPEGWNMGVPMFRGLKGAPANPDSAWQRYFEACEKYETALANQRALQNSSNLPRAFGINRSEVQMKLSFARAELMVREEEIDDALADVVAAMRRAGLWSRGNSSGDRPAYGPTYRERRTLEAARLWADFDTATEPSPWTPLVGPDGSGRSPGLVTLDSRGYTPMDDGGTGNSPWLLPETRDVTNTDTQSSGARPTSPQLRGSAQRMLALIDPPRDL